MTFFGITASVLGLGFIIFFHEAGHFFFAKLFNTGVLEFSIGMGPRIFSFVKNNTRYSLKAFPFGGSVVLMGEDEESEESSLSHTDSSESILFQNKKSYEKLVIIAAGVFNNFLLALIFSIIIVMFSGYDRLQVLDMANGSPVQISGLQKGENINKISISGKKTNVRGLRDLYMWLYLNEDSLNSDSEICLFTDDSEYSFSPYYDLESGKYRLGISFSSLRRKPDNVSDFIKDSWSEFSLSVNSVIKGLSLLIKGKLSRNDLSGPVGTVSVIGETVSESQKYGIFNAFLVLLSTLSLLSSNLAIMNLLPIPALDGGRIVFIIIEMLTGRRFTKAEEIINRIGISLIFLLMIFILINDTLKLVGIF